VFPTLNVEPGDHFLLSPSAAWYTKNELIKFSNTTRIAFWRPCHHLSVLVRRRPDPGDVLLAQQSCGEDLGERVFRELVALVDYHRHLRLKTFVIEGDGGYPPTTTAGAFDRRTRLEAADIVKIRLQGVGLGHVERA